MKFWWADQSKSFDMVFEDGTLWAARSGRRGAQLDYWRNLNSASPGDIVFHYVGPHVRAVSRVATMPRPAYPPRGYDVHPGTKGALVLTEPVCEVQIPRETVLAVLEDGYGPVNADGTLRRGYFFPLVPDQALALMRWAGLENVDEPDPGAEAFDQYLGGASDRLAVTAVRAEQRFLRDQQVRRWGSSCCLCGGSLSEELLVAAHIKPRWACSETERMDTGNVAMLACLFGCDALYELGYIVVDDQGRIGRGRPGSARVESRLQDLVGRRCPAYGEESGRYFAWHRQHHLDNQAEQS
ncbi:HNH endonuclease [Arthrobacter sp. E918]|uniref:HNH endonuclease n=2 Tax=Arthrobacter mobilis TaxID=2724944 RepID=A0A7X6K7W3_9MICC|nr:HNH endonuclease [Arthrobacter mobilis]